MKIGILQTGRALEDLRDKYGDFDAMFMRLLDGHGFSFATYPVLDDIFPEAPDACEGWLITGSKYSAYDDYPWIRRLEAFLREAYQRDVPIVGICFGHQVLAKALGGVVEKYPGGWGVGPHAYEMDGHEAPVIINAWHQDQVIEKPAEACVVGSSPFCANAALIYANTAFTIQAHPEFSDDFTRTLLDIRRDGLPSDVVARADHNFKNSARTNKVAAQIARFFKSRSITS